MENKGTYVYHLLLLFKRQNIKYGWSTYPVQDILLSEEAGYMAVQKIPRLIPYPLSLEAWALLKLATSPKQEWARG